MSKKPKKTCFWSCAAALTLAVTALADSSGIRLLEPNQFLNLDTGMVSASGGDVLWNGTMLMPEGRAGTYNLGKYGSRAFKAIRAKDAVTAPFAQASIPAESLVAGDVFGVHTNGGNYAKVIVTAVNGKSLTLEFTTFVSVGSGAANGGPVITQLQNNYSYILSGLPNYGIAPGSLFIIVGSGLSSSAPPVLPSFAATPSLPTSLNQTGISVTVAGVVTTPAIYYTSATQVAAVLPSTTPAGTGTLTLTYNSQASAAFPIKVIASALGLDTLYGTGNGSGVVTDNTTGATLSLTKSGTPGENVVLWGSGLGADTSNDDRTYPANQNNLTGIPMQVFVGGVSANVLYRGRSAFPGVDQIDITIPANAPSGCFVSVVAVSGTITSNSITIPLDPSGGPCSDPASGLNGTQLQTLANKGNATVNSVGITVNQQTNQSGTVSSMAFAIMSGVSGSTFGKGYEYASQGSCVIVPPEQGQIGNIFAAPLDAGTVQLAGPTGQSNLSAGGGIYQAQLPSGPLTSGTYTFTASGGKDVGSFHVAVNMSSPLTLTNKAVVASITRSQGATITWTGGFPNGDVQVTAAIGDQYGSVRLYCHAPSNAGQLTIPSSILLGMPAGSGSFSVTNSTPFQTFTASGVDVGLVSGTVITSLETTLK